MTKALPKTTETVLRFDFLASPVRIVGNDAGEVTGLEVEDTRLALKGNDTKAVGLSHFRVIPCDTVVFCIGDKVDDQFGLPVQWNAFVKNPNPAFPVDGISYEAFDPESGQALPGVFVAGWSREASSGLVGVARKDGENGARAVLKYLAGQSPTVNSEAAFSQLESALAGKVVIRQSDITRLEAGNTPALTDAERQTLTAAIEAPAWKRPRPSRPGSTAWKNISLRPTRKCWPRCAAKWFSWARGSSSGSR